MKSKVYNLMNWPRIEDITYAECDRPVELLGGHLCKQGFLIQIFRPDAVEVTVTTLPDNKKYPCEKVDEAGYYAVLIPSKKVLKYTISVENVKGRVHTYTDPYSIDASLKVTDLKKLTAGNATKAYEFMGATKAVYGGISGIMFAVWAPNARRVSVVGEFNDWDGRICQMNRDAEYGIYELFIPGLEAAGEYCYELVLKDGQVVRKADPYYLDGEEADDTFEWTDSAWKNELSKDKPLAICELGPDDLTNKNIVKTVVDEGFNCVELMNITSSVDKQTGMKAGNMCIVPQVGAKRLKTIINEFHAHGIAVIADCNMAYMEKGLGCLVYYDGTHLYGIADAVLDNHPELECVTYDYKKAQVRSYLYSGADYMIEHFHVDGLRLKEVASMLYLDYGKNPGEWMPNIYGGNDNIEAVDFIKGLRKNIDKIGKNTLLIAEDSSIWGMVTGPVRDGGLGFDYKWNDGWKRDFTEFYCTDPLFRKGRYNTLTHSMLYQYSEDFILEYSRDGYGWNRGLLRDMAPVEAGMVSYIGRSAQDLGESRITSDGIRIAHVKNALAYMYAFPGKKLVSLKELSDERYGLGSSSAEYMKKLNTVYMNTPALYENDNMPGSFEWIREDDEEETVLAFVRTDSKGEKVVCIANFTPVERDVYRIGVPFEGRYTDMISGDVYGSYDEEADGYENSIDVRLRGLEVKILTYKPYTALEKEQNAILKAANKSLREAKKQAEEAKRVQEEAKRAEEEAMLMAKEAKEADSKAQKAARQALKASEKAEKELEEAYRRCHELELKAAKLTKEITK